MVADSSIIMGRKLLPGIYSLGKDDVQKERNEPGSAQRKPCGQIPHLWGQALFIICRLLIEGLGPTDFLSVFRPHRIASSVETNEV